MIRRSRSQTAFRLLVFVASVATAFPAAAQQSSRAATEPVSQTVPGTNYPVVIHICPGRSCNQGKWTSITWENGRYVEHPGGREGATYVIESLTRERVLIRRTDYGRFPGRADLTGHLSDDGNRILDGTVRWTWHPCCGLTTGTFQAAWGTAISSVQARGSDRPAATAPSAPSAPAASSAAATPSGPAAPPVPPTPAPPAPAVAAARPADPPPVSAPVRAASPPAATRAPAWTSAPRPGHNINGTWEADSGEPGTTAFHHERILVYQLRNTIQAINIQGRRNVRPGTQFLIAIDAMSALPARFRAGVLAPDKTGLLDFVESSLSIDDPEHLHIGNEPPFHRVSSVNVDDMACQDGNPNHIAADDAFHRARAYALLKDLPTSNCWFHLAAEQGHAAAQAAYAHAWRTGEISGSPNTQEAAKWAQLSAAQRNAQGENELGRAILENNGRPAFGVAVPPTPAERARGQEWEDRSFLHNPIRVFNGDQSPVAVPAAPVIVADATPAPARGVPDANRTCDPARDRAVPLTTAYEFARANYASRNYGTAACWLYISAIQGNPDAALALGLFEHWGISVRQDDAQAFLWFRRAADADMLAAQDAVAHCYQFGIGTPKNPALAQLWTSQAAAQRALAKTLLAQRQQEAAQRAKEAGAAAAVGFLVNMLGMGPPSRGDRIESYRAQGLSAAAAESQVNDEENSATWWRAFGESLFGEQNSDPGLPWRR